MRRYHEPPDDLPTPEEIWLDERETRRRREQTRRPIVDGYEMLPADSPYRVETEQEVAS